MKKVGIITIHKICNYGSVLQAYALQTAISNLGYDCYIIDYDYPNEYHLNQMKIHSNTYANHNYSLKERIINKIFSYINKKQDQNYINDNFISLPDHFNCAFGKFYYSSGKEMFGKDADFNNIEQVHAQVHSLGHRIMQCISEKRKEDAVQDLEELQNTVSNLIEILDKLIDKYNI